MIYSVAYLAKEEGAKSHISRGLSPTLSKNAYTTYGVITMSSSLDINPDILVLLGSLLSVIVSQNLSTDEINVLGNFLTQVGASLLTKAAQQQSLQSKEELKSQIVNMEKQLENLKRQLC